MLGDREATATVAVKDIAVAKRFYEATLGLKQLHDVHVAGGMRVAWFTDPDGNIHSIVNR